VIVFTIGGGSFVENELMQQLADEMLKNHKIQVLYGCDKVYSPTEYISQLMKD